MIAEKHARQRLISRFCDHALARPLPELFLGSPKFFSIPTDNERGLFLFFLPLFLVLLHEGAAPRRELCMIRDNSSTERGTVSFLPGVSLPGLRFSVVNNRYKH